ncbi:DapH/DapD/GlmU-related protein [Salinivibrio sp. ML198]|uniref:acyltransferase n=1 Tax=Salinivibrio sp. ML198 TaxID=1909458 RepID=UPI000989810A|nr:acyltransferase [Salinivibrio sp. ML198]
MFKRIIFWLKEDRLGPDMPLTHFLLHSIKLQYWLCKHKFGKFGKDAEFRPGAYAVCASQIFIGSRVTIRPQSMLFASKDTCIHREHITIEDDVLIGSGVHIYVSNHKFDEPNQVISNQGHQEVKPVILRKGCWVGANSIILPGVEIGQNAVVGAGSVVTKSIPSFCVSAGNPCKVKKSCNTSELRLL